MSRNKYYFEGMRGLRPSCRYFRKQS
jgi:hypothetical protein